MGSARNQRKKLARCARAVPNQPLVCGEDVVSIPRGVIEASLPAGIGPGGRHGGAHYVRVSDSNEVMTCLVLTEHNNQPLVE